LDIGVLGYIGIVQHKEHSPKVLSIPPGTPCIFISILYTFRATLCSSSGESIVSIQHLVYVTLCTWPSGMQVGKFLPDLHTGRSPTQS